MLAALPGLLAAVAVALVAIPCGQLAAHVGAPIFALAFGALARTFVPLPPALKPGTAFASKTVLQAAIVCSGLALSLISVLRTGLETLPLTVTTIGVALLLAPVVGRLLKVPNGLRRLIGVGTAICGASAIAAISAVVEAPEADIALAIATIFFYNMVAIVVFPTIGHALHLSQATFGSWAGAAVNDTSSVLAVGYAFGHLAGAQATIVKLSRTAWIVPLVAFFALRRHGSPAATRWHANVPWFILWFLAATAVGGSPLIPASRHGTIVEVAAFLIAVALAAIGLQTDLRQLRSSAAAPMVLGFVLWIGVAVTALMVLLPR